MAVANPPDQRIGRLAGGDLALGQAAVYRGPGDYAGRRKGDPDEGRSRSVSERKGNRNTGVVDVHPVGDDVALTNRRQRQHNVEPEVKLDEQGDVAEELDIDEGHLGHQPVARQPAHADEYPQ